MSDPRVRILLQFWQMHDVLPPEFCRDRIAPLIVSRLEYLWAMKGREPHDDALFLAKLRQAHDDMTARIELHRVWTWQYLAPTFDNIAAHGDPSIPLNERHIVYSARGREPFHSLVIRIDRTRGEHDLVHEEALNRLWAAGERPVTPQIVAHSPVVDLREHL